MKTVAILMLFMLAASPGTQRAQGSKTASAARKKGGSAVMVKIPGGYYRPFLQSDNQPVIIQVPAFYLDKHAVTNAEFLLFVKANPQWSRSRVSRIFADDHYLKQWAGDFDIGNDKIINSPVTNVSWFAADAYCKWRGARLPTLAEWEYAASALPKNMKKGNNLLRIILEWYDRPTPAVLPPVESIYLNHFGVYDMHGLVWEWVSDFNSINIQSAGKAANTFTCGAGSLGTFNKEDYAAYMRYAFRGSLQAAYTVGSLGFRCAQDIEDNAHHHSNYNCSP
ncbi:formylglycine-generating enzyme family protein [Asinibacterium sp. OR53]|uniref:formylglycine-generating enzyme family protein n=1 Tax=Asinibacterium sp. OR53 TaxID=925409 RepID=UPI0004B4224F|nr:formylglycine-generating enzyme family protein [Asinibacterium sp. OR53]